MDKIKAIIYSTMQLNRSRFITYTAMCAALYAVSIVAFAFIPTPFGVGHFRPTIVIPQFFAFLGGPWVAAIGAAIGTFLGDVFGLWPAGLSNPLLSLIAGVPANFFGFLLFGYLIRRFNTWQDYIWVTLVSLFIGNLIAATGVAFSLGIFFGQNVGYTLEYRLYLITGLTLFWVITMIPFSYIITPILLRYLSSIATYSINLKGNNVLSSSGLLAILIGLILLISSFLILFPFHTSFSNILGSIITPEEFGIMASIAGFASIIVASLASRIGTKKI